MVRMRVHMTDAMAEAVRELAEDWALPMTVIMRAAVTDLLGHQERLPALLAPMVGPLIDSRTPEQVAAGEAYLQAMAQVDMEAVARELGGRTGGATDELEVRPAAQGRQTELGHRIARA
jgi:hypothetical protein